MESRKPACILCRGVKLKCVNDNNLTQRCQRCERNNLPCAYSKRRRRVRTSNPKILPAPRADSQLAGPPGPPLAVREPPPSDSFDQHHVSGPPPPPHPPNMDTSGSSSQGPSRLGPPSVRQPPLADPSGYIPPTHAGPSNSQQPWASGMVMNALLPSMGNVGNVYPHFPADPSPQPSSQGHAPRGKPASISRSHSHLSPATQHSDGSPNHSQHAPPPPVADLTHGNHRMSQSQTVEMREAADPEGHEEEKEISTRAKAEGWEELPFVSVAAKENGRERRNMLDDPLMMGYLNDMEAMRLVDMFHQYLNPMIALQDPQLHTCGYLRERSSLVFSAVLAAAAKYFHKPLYPRLLSHAQKLLSSAIEQGVCNTGVIQALLILVYWKEPTDQSAWIKIGMAVRLGYQLGWHERWNKPPQPVPSDPVRYREQLDTERTWFCLAAFDRTYAGVYNLPFAIRAHEVGDMEAWIYDHQHLDIVNDLRLACSLETLFITDGIRNWKMNIKNMSKEHSLAQIERLFETAVRVNNKWCVRSDGLNRLTDKQRVFLRLYHNQLLFGIRWASLAFIPPQQLENATAETVDRAVAFVEQLKIVCDEGLWHFQQDIASAKLASFCAILQELFWKVTNPQRRVVLSCLKTVYEVCLNVADGVPDAPSAFVARFLERLLGTMRTSGPSVAPTRGASPASNSQPPANNIQPIDVPVLDDLTTFLNNAASYPVDPEMANFDEAYWTSLFASLPLNMEDFNSL